MRIQCVYLVSSSDGRVLVGSTNNFYRRLAEYKSKLLKGSFGNVSVQRWADDVGFLNLKFEVIQTVDKLDFLKPTEDSLISYYKGLRGDRCLNAYTASGPPRGVVPPLGKQRKSVFYIDESGVEHHFQSCSEAAIQTGGLGPSIGEAASAKYSTPGNRFYKVGKWFFNEA